MSDRLINYAKISPLDPEQGIILGRFNFQGRKEIYDHGAEHMTFLHSFCCASHNLYYFSKRIEILGKIIVFFFKFDDLERVI